MLVVFFWKTHQKTSQWGPVCTTQYKYYGKKLKVVIIIVANNRFLHDSQAMPRCCVAAGCDSISGKGYSLHKFPKDESICKGGGLMLSSNDSKVAGMGHPWILSCAPGILKMPVL